MAETKWSPEQQRVIDTRDADLLVSAAAGAGKTAVLTEHILGLVRDTDIDIDRLLIVTFTNAAAGEMRERIGNKFAKALEADPSNRRLKKQQMLLHNASIMTIDSFCLGVVREFFHEIDLDPGFRIGQQAEISLMEKETLSEVLEECYAEGSVAFTAMIESLGNSRGDGNVEKVIKDLYKSVVSHPWPMEWLSELEEAAQDTDRPLDELPWMKILLDASGKYMEEALNLLDETMSLADEVLVEPAKPMMVLEQEHEYFEGILHATEISYKAVCEAYADKPGVSLRFNNKVEDKDSMEEVKAVRKAAKALVDGHIGKYYKRELEDIAEERRMNSLLITELVRVTRMFAERFAARKRDRNIIDFNDLEHFALEILVSTDENGVRHRTKAAEELQHRYAKIFIDEYQDSNEIQECITDAIVGTEPGGPKTFMVGDVKQSIYKFRMAKPELFIARMERYMADSTAGQLISLHMNFRSRREVLDSTNDVFMMTMRDEIGGITYTEECALNAGEKQPPVDPEGKYATEVVIVTDEDAENDGESEDEAVDSDTYTGFDYAEDDDRDDARGGDDEDESAATEGLRELEARAAARIIRRLISDRLPVQGKQGDHPVGYGDIVILLRSMKGWLDTYLEVFEEENIPAYSDASAGFLSTMEISTMLDYLRILDNPRQDIPLAAVLHSPLVGLSADELATIRIEASAELSLYDAVRAYADKNERVRCFLEIYDRIGSMNRNRDIDRMIEAIYEATGFYTYCTALPGGARRASNLDMLLSYAADYERSSYSGLFSFVRYVEQLLTAELDLEEAVSAEAQNAVRIMTIHKSKGLEFPVVIVGGMGKALTNIDARNTVIVNADFGIGAPGIDPMLRIKRKTLEKAVKLLRMKLDYIGEEERLLYVAMTRAVDKLIMLGGVSKLSDRMKKWTRNAERGEVGFVDMVGARSYFDMVCPAAISGGSRGRFDMTVWTPGDLKARKAEEVSQTDDKRRDYEQADLSMRDPDTLRRFAYGYPHEDTNILPMKLTVSALKEAEAETSAEDNAEAPVMQEIPAHIAADESAETISSGSGRISGAELGTLYHRIMQFLPTDLGAECGADGHGKPDEAVYKRVLHAVAQFLETLVKRDIITLEESKAISWERLANFLCSDICRRMREAEKHGFILREQPFVMGVRASDINDRYAGIDELIPVQGVIDCLFTEEDGIVIVDYKTDRVAPGEGEELVKRYHAQLEYYAGAATQLLGKPVREKIIYSLVLGEEIRL